MSVFERMFKRRKQKGLTLPATWQRFVAAVPFGGFADTVEDAYRRNATVFACLQILQWTFPEPELWAWEMPENMPRPVKIAGHPLRRLMNRPNPDMGEAELYQTAVTYAALGGNSYLWKQRDREGRVMALWPLHDGQMTPVAGRNTNEGLVAYYVLRSHENANPWGIARHDTLVGVAIPKSEIVHWKWAVDPLHPERGMGALEASAGDVRLANEIRDFVYSYLKNDAVPPLVVTLAEGDVELDDAKVRRLRKQWKDAHSGANRGTPAFLEYGMKAEMLGYSLRELAYDSLSDGPDAAICAGFHIHPAVVGAMVGLKYSTYSNFEEANRALALQTLVPLWRSFASEMRQSLAGEIGFADDVIIRFDLSEVRALQDSQNAIEERLGRAFDRGGITRAEYRRALGYEVTPEDEVFKENLASIWVPRGMLRTADPELLAAEAARQQGETAEGKAAERETKAAQDAAAALRRIRRGLLPKMEASLRGYFRALGEGVEKALREAASPKGRKGIAPEDAEGLLRSADGGALEDLLKKYYAQVLELSWEVWNVSLGVHVAFDLEDPTVAKILALAGTRVKDIHETTLQALRDVLQYGATQGWSVDDLVRGDPAAGVRGIRDVVTETYTNRARAIARTELGTAQNLAAVQRYREAGVTKVEILDNGDDDDDDACKVANGQVWSVDYFEAHPLEHPNCTRAAAPYFGTRRADRV